MKTYCIGKFSDEGDAIASFPSKWLISPEMAQCWWPPKQSKKKIKTLADPLESWTLCNVKVLHYYDTLEDAQANVQLALLTSDLETTSTVPKTPQLPIKLPEVPNTVGLPLDQQPSSSLGPSASNTDVDIANVEAEENELPGNQVADGEIEALYASELQELSNFELSSNPVLQVLDVAKIDEPLKAIKTDLKSLHQKVDDIKEALQSILAAMTSASNQKHQTEMPKCVKLPEKFVLPLTSLDEFIRLNEFLSTQEGTKSLGNFLFGTGGNTYDDAVQRSVEKLILDDIGNQFSLKRSQTRMSLINYKGFCNSLKDAVQSFPCLSLIVASGNADDRKYEESVQAVLKKIHDRVLARKRNAKQANEEGTDQTI